MSGKVVHFEIPYDDAERAGAFYRSVFGWEVIAMPEMDYTIASTGPTDSQSGMPKEPGFINGGMFQRTDVFTGPTVTVDVASIDETLRAAEGAGGTTIRGREPVGEMGFAAYLRDPEGNLVGLWETA
jgi:hypothetical protein